MPSSYAPVQVRDVEMGGRNEATVSQIIREYAHRPPALLGRHLGSMSLDSSSMISGHIRLDLSVTEE